MPKKRRHPSPRVRTRCRSWRLRRGAAREPIDPDLAPDDPGEPSVLHLPASTAAFRRAEPGVLMAISFGGMAGAGARYGISRIVHVAPGTFPWATFWTNVTGAFALGLVLVVLLERFATARHARAFLTTGVIGAYTTMSTFEVEGVILFKDGHLTLAVAYTLGSVAAGLAAAILGIRLGRRICISAFASRPPGTP